MRQSRKSTKIAKSSICRSQAWLVCSARHVCNTFSLRERQTVRESVSTTGSHHSMGSPPQASFVRYIFTLTTRWDLISVEAILSNWDTSTHMIIYNTFQEKHTHTPVTCVFQQHLCSHHVPDTGMAEVFHRRIVISATAKLLSTHDPHDVTLSF